MLVVLAAGLGVALLGGLVFAVLQRQWGKKGPSVLEELGVPSTYPWGGLPEARIKAYGELKERVRREFAADSTCHDDTWMSRLPAKAKDSLKFHLMQRAIGDMAALRKIDADMRGFWRLFSKGIVTHKFWSSVVEAERLVSAELELVKGEAVSVEPAEDPRRLMSEAMQFLVRYGDTFPTTAAAGPSIDDLLGQFPGQRPSPGQAGPMGPGGPMGSFPPGARPAPPPAPAGGESEDEVYSWKQDADEVEVSVAVPNNAQKSEVKVAFKPQVLVVELNGKVIVEGGLARRVDPSGCTWTMSRGRVVVSLEKADAQPWPGLFAAKA